MITQISYNVLIERLRAFADGHFLIKGFTHGHPSNIDIEKGLTFPWMHVYPVEVEPRAGSRLYTFIITFADLPRDKETPAEYEREVISDCIKLAEDLIAEIQNGLVLFGPTVELEGSPSIEVFIQEYSQTLTGVNLALTLSVPWDWSACDIPADWSVGGSGSGGTGSGGTGVILETNGVLNGDQTLLNLEEGTNVTIVDDGFGTITISAVGGGGEGTVTSVALTAPPAFSVSGSPITGAGTLALSASGISSQYIDGSGNLQAFPNIPAAQVPSDWAATTGVTRILNKPTIPAAQVNSDWNSVSGVSQILNKPTIPAAQIQSDWNQANNAALDFINNKPTIPAAQLPSDWNATTGVTRILNKPTIPAAQVNSDWNATSGLAEILNKPTIPAAQVNSDWNAVSGLAQILNKPTIPTTLDSLTNVNVPSPTNAQVLSYDTASGQWVAVTPSSGGSVTSVALSMPAPANPAFSVSGSPITTSGTLAVAANGTIDQYVDGTGALRTLPSTGGGGGQIFYFNGNTSQGTIGGNAFYQLGTAAGTGAAANFTLATTGVIARFITNVGSPNHLILPSGVWTVDVYLSETGGGSNHAQIEAKLYKVTGTTLTLIGTSPIEQITNGNVVDLYTFGISVPNTVTLASDRVAILFDILNTNGKTVTLYTEASRIGEVHSTYAIGLSSLNGLTDSTQTFAVGTTGTDFGISSASNVHTFNLPTASASNRGALSSADWSTFNAKQNAIGLSTVGNNLATLTNPNAITFLRVNADNSVTARTPSQVLSDLGVSANIILNRNFTDTTAHTGTTANTIIFTVLIPANTLQANDFINFKTFVRVNTAATTIKVYLNTTATIPTLSPITIGDLNLAANNGGLFERNIMIPSSGVTGSVKFFQGTALSAFTPANFAATSATINTTVDQYIVFAAQNSTVGTSFITNGNIIQLTR